MLELPQEALINHDLQEKQFWIYKQVLLYETL